MAHSQKENKMDRIQSQHRVSSRYNCQIDYMFLPFFIQALISHLGLYIHLSPFAERVSLVRDLHPGCVCSVPYFGRKANHTSTDTHPNNRTLTSLPQRNCPFFEVSGTGVIMEQRFGEFSIWEIKQVKLSMPGNLDLRDRHIHIYPHKISTYLALHDLCACIRRFFCF